jgi:hypothetical protein
MPALNVYFDNSALDAVALQGKGGRLKALLKLHSAVGYGSAQNLIEAFGIADRAKRMELVRTILQVARRREADPLLYREVTTVVDQIRRHHPDWIVGTPDLTQISEDRAAYRAVWQLVKADAGYLPRGFVMNRAFQYAVIGESKRRAKEARADRVKGLPRRSPIIDPSVQAHLQPAIDALGDESAWRLEAGAIWWNAAHQRDDQMKSLSDWLIHLVNIPIEHFEDWMRFWLVDVDGAAVNVTRVQMLAGLFQADVRVNAGLSGDVLHAAQATQCDVIVTADRDFYDVLQEVAATMGVTIARAIFVERGRPDIVAEITTGLGW